jgi:hypothetical protein
VNKLKLKERERERERIKIKNTSKNMFIKNAKNSTEYFPYKNF